jgi:LPS export ABC transporter permease LptF/LPS export ABC transporter permease LptG
MALFKRFDRYVMGEISIPFYLGLTVYSFTMLVNTFFLLSELLISKSTPPLTVVRMLLFTIPAILSLTIPMATLMGILAGLSRMSTDSEVLALRTLGVHHRRLYRPVLIFSLLTWMVASLFSMYVAPEALYQFRLLQNQVRLSKGINQIKPRTFYTEMYPYVLYFEDIDPKTREWKNVFLYSYKLPETDMVVLAERGLFTYTSEDRRSGYMTLLRAKVHSFNRSKPQDGYRLTSYERLIEEVPEYHNQTVQRMPEHLPVRAVWELLKKDPMKKDPGSVRVAIEFHNRFAFPFATLALGFLGVSLGISTRRGGRTSGFVLSLAIIFVYYALMTLGRNLALSRAIPPSVGIWGANLFLLGLGLVVFRLTSRGVTLRLEFFRRFGERIHLLGRGRVGRQARPRVVLHIYRSRVPFIKILDLYILRRLGFMFTMIFLSLMAVMYISKILELIDNIFKGDLPFSLVFVYLYHNTPELISITLPIAVLTSVLLTFSLMSKQNEITTIQVSGISLRRIIVPALVFGLVISLLFFALQERVLPGASERAKEVLDTIYGVNRDQQDSAESQKYWAIDKDRRIFFYSQFDTVKQEFTRFNVIELDTGFALKSRLSAKTANWRDATTLVLHHGMARHFENLDPVKTQGFGRRSITVPEGERYFKKIKVKERSTDHMSMAQLRTYVDYLQENQSDATRYQAKIYQKVFYPFSSLIMVLIAIPFAFMMGKKGSMHGIGVAVVISMVFMGMIGFLNSFGNNGLMSPLWSSLIPYLFFTLASLVMMVRIRT